MFATLLEREAASPEAIVTAAPGQLGTALRQAARHYNACHSTPSP